MPQTRPLLSLRTEPLAAATRASAPLASLASWTQRTCTRGLGRVSPGRASEVSPKSRTTATRILPEAGATLLQAEEKVEEPLLAAGGGALPLSPLTAMRQPSTSPSLTP